MLKHTIALRQSSGLNTREDRRLKQFIEEIGVPKYVMMLWKNKTYVPTVGRQMIQEFISGGHELSERFRRKVSYLESYKRYNSPFI